MPGHRLRQQILTFCCAAVLALPVQAALYKWVDENGEIHYGDRPPSDAGAGHEIYNQQGVAVGSVARALNDAERAERKRLEAEARALVAAEEQRRHRDRVLLETFTTERDLLLARDDRIGALDAAIALSSKHQNNWQTKLERVANHIADIEKGGQVAPMLLVEERDSLQRKIAGAEDFTAQKMIERNELAAQFDDDIQRFRQLKLEQAELAKQLGRD